ncbi:MAG: SRPBCC family protein [Dehalococcoidia bacterium]|nr:SRPBCC family protein [Dehalococcoidia bacterium]MCA9857432.1 SRPBCC family protein [Dehalococcoidia bacterium]MCB9491661.1 SRPBCC family protein [Dehalococcoidia bacterium]
MARAASEIVVEAPLQQVYNQWTQFEAFPRFMGNVEQVQQIDDRRLHWKAKIGGQDVEWDAEIEEQVPDDKIVWRSLDGAMNYGLVRFNQVDANQTQVHLEMSYEPEGVLQKMGDALGVLDRDVDEDLKNFKSFIEDRDAATGAWRGEIENPNAPGGHTEGHGTPDV